MSKKLIPTLSSLFGKEEQYAYLKQFCIFQDFKGQELKLVDNLVNRRVFKKDEFLFQEGYPMESLYLLESGLVQLSSKAGGNQQQLSAGAILGMMDAQLEGGRRSTAQAQEETVAYGISMTDINYLIDHNPTLGIKLLRAIAKYFSETILRCLNP